MSPLLSLLTITVGGTVGGTLGGAPAQPAIADEIEARVGIVRRWAREPIVVATVAAANAEPLSSSTIETRDRQWQATAGIDPFMREILDAPCSHRLRDLSARTPELSEAFVTDRRGANVAMTRKTSDYWQGDEDKFQRAFTGRLDAYHVDPVQFDESIQAYAVQISVPVVAGGATIGVLVVTVNLERLVEGL